MAAFWQGAFLAALSSSLIAPAMAAPLPEFEVGTAMQRVERLISQFGIDVTGYALTEAP